MVRNLSASALWERQVAHVVYSIRLTRHKKLNTFKYLYMIWTVKIYFAHKNQIRIQ